MGQSQSYSRRLNILKLNNKIKELTPVNGPQLTTGFDDIDVVLGRGPRHGLATNALHIIEAARLNDMPAALGFAVSLALRFAAGRPLFWVQNRSAQSEWGVPYLPGLRPYGVAAEQLWYVAARSFQDWAWALEEIVSCPDIGCALGVTLERKVSFVMSRRLTRAAQSAMRPILLLTLPQEQKLTADTHWRIRSGAANSWHVELLRQKQVMQTAAPHWHIAPQALPPVTTAEKWRA
jgi:hypothetical protein